ncbi:MAG: hypothetical protein IH624_13005 [Phycisphaerae bacterium]|nr:hypothetical protein [Phycisphaerae bacterium]
MKRSWVIWTVILVLLGGFGLAAVVVDMHQEKRQVAKHKMRHSQAADEYLQQYLEWSTLSANERAENPWGQGRYGGAELREKLIHQQDDRLKADLADLSSGTTTPGVVAEVLYGPDWQQQIEAYRKRSDLRDGVAVISTMSILAGLIVCIGYAVHHSLHSVLSPSEEKKTASGKPRPGRPRTADPDESESENAPETKDLLSEIIAAGPEAESEADDDEHPAPSIGVKSEAIGYFRNFGLSTSSDRTGELKNTLRNKAASFKPTDKPKSAAGEGGALGMLMSSSPVASELTELTQEVSAIREFASQQQDRVRQLQDGYDWSIIKRFCLRIIRCIDNLDERMAALPPEGADMQSLLDVRDELVFSLESSGVEQFEPELNKDYKGLEKSVEAVKSREPATAPALVGKIAAVVRPGYRYVVSDNDIKIVRCAQVKLYGDAS